MRCYANAIWLLEGVVQMCQFILRALWSIIIPNFLDRPIVQKCNSQTCCWMSEFLIAMCAGGKQFAISHVQDDIPADFDAQMDLQAKDLMIPFQCFCSRRGVCTVTTLPFLVMKQNVHLFFLHLNFGETKRKCRCWLTTCLNDIHKDRCFIYDTISAPFFDLFCINITIWYHNNLFVWLTLISTVAMQGNCPGWNRCVESNCWFCCEQQGR